MAGGLPLPPIPGATSIFMGTQSPRPPSAPFPAPRGPMPMSSPGLPPPANPSGGISSTDAPPNWNNMPRLESPIADTMTGQVTLPWYNFMVFLCARSATIQQFNSEIATINGQISTLNGQVSTLQGQVSTLESQVATLNAEMAQKDNDAFAFNPPNPPQIFQLGTNVMVGLNLTFTPLHNTRFFATFMVSPNVGAGTLLGLQGNFGTGAPPGSNTPATGAGFTAQSTITGGTGFQPTSLTGLITGLTIGTQYWIDIQAFLTATSVPTNLYNINATLGGMIP